MAIRIHENAFTLVEGLELRALTMAEFFAPDDAGLGCECVESEVL